MRCWPTTGCSISRPICGGWTSPPPGWGPFRRRYGMTGERRPERLDGAPLLAAVDVVKSFGATPALRRASLAVAAGEIVAVMGPSGSGKSTLLHCLAGILTPDAGEVRFDGRRLDTMGEPERSALRRERFGFVFQSGQLVPELTAEEN